MKMISSKQFDVDLIINSLGRGGAERICVTLANELNKKGYKVRIITLKQVTPNYIENVEKKVVIETLDAKKDLIGILYLKKILAKEKFSIIFSFDERITSMCNYVRIKKNKKYKVISRIINNIDLQAKYNKKIVYKPMYAFSKKYTKYSDKIIFQCREMMTRMINYFSINTSNCKTVYIYNPLSEKFHNIQINNNKENYYIMVGRLVEQKGYDSIIETAKVCKENNKEIHIKIFGDGEKYNELMKKIKKYNLNIELLGNVKDIENYYKKAKALILTSKYEGFPNVLLEANACGCPVISFDCPTGPSEIVTKDNGILINNSVNELVKVLMNFDNNKWNYNIIKKTTDKYKDNCIIEKYIKEIFDDGI